MSGFNCPYCKQVMSITSDTFKAQYTSFEDHDEASYNRSYNEFHDSAIKLFFYKCPNCNKYSIFVKGAGEKVEDINTTIIPKSSAKQFPEYIPKVIRNDYEEAYAIVNLSPKASATLSRRCLQGMIHDFWDIKLKNLNQEITALKDMIEPDLWSAIDSLRQLGNIGAHMEKDTGIIVDIDSNEANTLIKLIELLMKEWYINREERKKLIEEIVSINGDKQDQRKITE